jgi:phosphoribosylglycinamide formyltransferase-1
MLKMKQKLAIFLSGTGSNARAVCQYFQGHERIEVALLLSNRKDSGAQGIGIQFDIPVFMFSRDEFYNTSAVADKLKEYGIDALILAGFLWLIPHYLLHHYHDRILNIHPALLPKYGGKGMHGHHVHRAVFDNKEKSSGITIHLCNENYDEGKVLFQRTVEIDDNDTVAIIADKVLKLEHAWYPRVIENYLTDKHNHAGN